MISRRAISLALPLAGLTAGAFIALRPGSLPPPGESSPAPAPVTAAGTPHITFLSHDWIELPPRPEPPPRRLGAPRSNTTLLDCYPDDPAARCRNCMRIRLFGATL